MLMGQTGAFAIHLDKGFASKPLRRCIKSGLSESSSLRRRKLATIDTLIVRTINE